MAAPSLNTPRGRLAFFGLMYVLEGIPQGFSEKFMPFYLGKAGLSSVEIGNFGWYDFWPWTVKWMFAPFVDLLFSRRKWLWTAQIVMMLTLLPIACSRDLASSFSMLTMFILTHNIFSATNDIAIDALMVEYLPENEESFVNGVVFAAMELGMIVGGSGALLLSASCGYFCGVFGVCMSVLLLFLSTTCRLPVAAGSDDGSFEKVLSYFMNLRTSFLGGWQIWVCIVFAICPSGPLLLGGPHCTTWMQQHGMQEVDVSAVETVAKLVGVVTNVLGGLVSARLGPRSVLAFSYLGLSCLCLFLCASTSVAWSQRWWMAAKVAYHAFGGLQKGPQMALYMRSCTAAVAATQFTLFCSLSNTPNSWASSIHGRWINNFGFSQTLWWDALIGLTPLIVLPFLGKHAGVTRQHED